VNQGNAHLVAFLDGCKDREVWIFGDLMLDEYVHGPVNRISPEAPVPVVRVESVEYRMGGAANVAGQVAALGARAVLAGPIGTDWAGEKLLDLCTRAGIETRCVVPMAGHRTTRKLRVLGQGQQLLRLDWEEPGACPGTDLIDILEKLGASSRPDAIILSDYAKGAITPATVTRMARVAAALGAKVLVDPKSADFASYRGADILTPNLAELSLAAGRRLDRGSLDDIATAARALMESAGLPAMVVTLSERGLMVLTADAGWHHVPPAVRRAVRDVTGAGDTVIATLATGLAAGASLPQAAEIANTAAGLAVREIGAVAIGADQIRHALGGQSGAKLLGRGMLASRADLWRKAGKRIVFANGCFDILHAGHLSLLQQAAELGDVLIVAINSDESVRRLKGPERPVVAEQDRARLVAALECVDAVTLFDEDTPLAALEAVRPDVLVKGQDYVGREVVGRELVEAGGGQVVLLPILAGRSSTSVVDKIRKVRSGS
jgi:D-beta-D-heptose 7-phosphate kinase/D-beta-D-heptose 1-phosphate adenosyltransferase